MKVTVSGYYYPQPTLSWNQNKFYFRDLVVDVEAGDGFAIDLAAWSRRHKGGPDETGYEELYYLLLREAIIG
jgi:hypothetical protein